MTEPRPSPEPDRTPPSILVGRAVELRHLEQCWKHARAGEGQAVFIAGEAGIGKSRLVTEIEAVARAENARSLRLQCSALKANSDLHPLQDHLVRVADMRREDSDGVRAEKIERLLTLASSGQADPKVIAGLVALTGPTSTGTATPDPRRTRREFMVALLDGLAAQTRDGPILLTIEDAHWLDPTSRDLLDRVIARAADQHLMIVVTARREYDPAWISMPHASVLIVKRLGPADALAMTKQLAANAGLSAAALEHIAARSEGLPLIVEELSKGNAADGARAPDVVAVPASLEAVLTARLDQAGDAKPLAQIAAALGRHFNHDTVAQAFGHGETEVEACLARLMVSEIVLAKPIRRGSQYAFRHALLQEAAYASMSPSERIAAHGKIAKALDEEAETGPSDQPEILAHHCDRSNAHLVAAGHWLTAGKRAAARGAAEEAVNAFKSGLASVSRAPDSDARERLTFALDRNRGPALMAVKGYASEEGLSAFLAARRRLAWSNSSLEETHVLLGLFNVHFGRGELDKALEVAGQADRFLTVGYGGYPTLLGQTLCMMGRFHEARSTLMRALDIYDPSLDEGSGLFSPADVVATSFLAKVEFALGNFEQTVELTGRATDLARQHCNPLGLAIADLGRIYLATEQADFSAAQRMTDEALAYVTEHNLGNFRLWIAFHSAALSVRTDPGAAVASMERILNEADAAGTLMFRPMHLGLLGVAYAATGKTDQALDAISRGLEIARATSGFEALPALHRFRAKVLQATNPQHAIAELEVSLAVARGQSALTEELRSATALARMLKGTGREDYAKACLSQAVLSFKPGLDFPDLKQAVRVLSSLAASA